MSIPVEKQWNDAGNEESRPASIDVVLKRGESVIRTMTLDQENNWKGVFTDLPKYEAGEELIYTVEEVSVDGYITETEETENGEILIRNTPTKVTIKEVDENNEFVSGAILAVKDPETGKDIMTMATDDKAIDITGKLTAGKTYYLTETSVPEGYLQAADVEFTVPEDGSTIEVTMVDRKIQDDKKLGQINVTKKIALLNDDKEFVLYAADATYYVRETLADGTPLPIEELIDDTYVCMIEEDESEKVEITAGATAETGLVNIYYDIPDGYFVSASIDITKEVLKNGETMETDDVFYAGIFTSETEETPIQVESLVNNGTITVQVPLCGEDGKQSVTYYIFETDASGKKLNKNSFAYTVSGEDSVTLNLENLEGAVTIINEKKEENTTPTPSAAPTLPPVHRGHTPREARLIP